VADAGLQQQQEYQQLIRAMEGDAAAAMRQLEYPGVEADIGGIEQ
jgi:hypothetical protein